MTHIFSFFRFLSSKLPITSPKIILSEINCVVRNKQNSDSLRILDLGCGDGSIWSNSELSDCLVSKNVKITLIDANQGLLERSQSGKEPRFFHEVGVLPQYLQKFQADEFDIVLAIDLIEHLSKEDGYHLLYEIDRIAQYSSIILTPNGFLWQPPALNNSKNAHISSWTVKELRNIGWDNVRGLLGLKMFWGPYGQPKNKPTNTLMWEFFAFQKILCFLFPRLSISFRAIKRRKLPRNSMH